MGVRTLEGFRDGINLALGEKKQTNERLDRWINDGLNELFTILDSEGRRTTTTFPTVAGQSIYTLPTDLYAILTLKDRTNDRVLLKTAAKNFELLDDAATGKPNYYRRIGREIELQPIPSAVLTMELIYIFEHAPLTLASDTTDLPNAFDRPVQLLAQRAALMDLRELETATFFYQTAVNLVRSLPNPFVLEGETPARGIEIAYTEEDLRRAR